jgi:hypothetical protein
LSRFWIFTTTAAVLIGLVGLAVLALDADLRRAAFTRVIPAFDLYQMMSVRRHVREREFEVAAGIIQRHISLSRRLSRSRSRMVLGLVEVTGLVAERARLQSEHDALLPVLEQLVELEPDLYMGRVWLARALWRRDPAAALVHVNRAIALVDADERAYRVGIEAATKSGDDALVESLCTRYASAQFGGPTPRSYQHMFVATGLRKMALEAVSPEGRSVIATNHGVTLGEQRSYDFVLPESSSAKEFALHLGFLPGVRMKLHALEVSYRGAVPVRYEPNSLLVTARTAYITAPPGEALVILSTGVDDELIRIRFGENAEQRQMDAVRVEAEFTRLPLASLPGCRPEGARP